MSFFKKIVDFFTDSEASDNSIYVLYRIEEGKIKTFGYFYEEYRAKKWADAGKYQILKCEPF